MPDRDNRDQGVEQEQTVLPGGTLHSYDQRKHELAQVVREGLAAARDAKREGVERALQEVSAKLAGDRFNLVVVGQFSRGKSTLMNALLGKTYLPSGIVPVTSVITAVGYGVQERVVLRFVDSNLTHPVTIDKLTDYVTEQANPGNRKRIEVAEVQAPVEILRRGFFFVDTPGLGSVVQQNTATTLNFLPEADAIVFVTSCDAPLTNAELAYLRECKSQARRVFVIVNKMDLAASTAEREQILNFVESKVRQELDTPELRIFAVSARNALDAKTTRDTQGLERSGVADFEKELIQYLTVRKQDDFLLGMCDRVEALLRSDELAIGEGLEELVDQIRTEIVSGLSISEKIEEPRKRVRVRGVTGAAPVIGWTCEVCDEILDAVFNFLRTYQYKLSTSEGTQLEHAKTGGFCPLHTWQYANLASPQGVCNAYPQLLFRFSRELRELGEFGTEGYHSCVVVDPPLPPYEACRACQVASQAEERAIECLAKTTPGHDLPSKNFCLQHLHDLLLRLRDISVGCSLLLALSEKLARVGENMQRHALQFEGRRRDLMTDEELQAPRQGLTSWLGTTMHSTLLFAGCGTKCWGADTMP